MMTLKEINSASDHLANMFNAGTVPDKILARMVQMQPKQSEFWRTAQNSVAQGNRLSESLAQVWPASLVDAIRAGEVSGKIEQALTRITETTAIQLGIRTSLKRLIWPFVLILFGVAIFIFYMVAVLPNIGRATGIQSESFMMKLSAQISQIGSEHGLFLGVVLVGGILVLCGWLRSSQAQLSILNAGFSVPVLKEALRDLYFGIWANYMAMMSEAGLPTEHGLKLTQALLPAPLQTSVGQFTNDLIVNHRSMTEAADPSLHTDERATWWPFYISQAFMMADSTGRVDTALLKVAPALIKEGSQRLGQLIQACWIIATLVTALTGVAPLIAYYMELGNAFTHSGF